MRLIGINKSYGGIKVLEDFNLEFDEGKITCLLGPSGCGKTTILNVISGLTPYEGALEGGHGKISYIFQDQRLLPNLTVYGNLDFVLKAAEKDKAIRRQKITDELDAVELTAWSNAYPSQLSGGMAQRAAMARAFVHPSSLLLMDEPFKALDISLKKRLTAVFIRLWQRDGRTVIFVTHDVDEALLLADRVVLLSDKAKVIYSLDLHSPQTERQLSDDDLLRARQEIYKNFNQ